MIKPLNNWQLKLISLLSAVILWFFVVGIGNTMFVFPENIDIKLTNINKNISLASTLPSVRVYVKTDQEIFKNLTKNDFEVYLDLKDLSAGDHLVPVLVSTKNNQVTILKVDPKEVNIKLAPIAQKEVPVITSISGMPKTGYNIKDVKTDLKKVTISGAQNILDQIGNVKAELVLDGTQIADISQDVTLKLPDISTVSPDSVTINPDQITFTGTIVQEVKQKTVPVELQLSDVVNKEIFLKNVTLSPSEIIIHGNEDLLKQINSIKTKPIDPRSAINSLSPLPLELDLPAGITVDLNTKVTMSLKFSSDQEKTVQALIVFTKQNKNFQVKTSQSAILVTVLGDKNVIKTLKDNDITLNINLENVSGPGPILIDSKNIILPDGLELLDFSPRQIQLDTI